MSNPTRGKPAPLALAAGAAGVSAFACPSGRGPAYSALGIGPCRAGDATENHPRDPGPDHVSGFSDRALGDVVEQIASTDPTPGAGPSLAWTCAFAAALVEMVTGVALRHDPADPAAVRRRRDRATTLRTLALELADRDASAYSAVLGVLERRGEPGHSERLRDALSHAADPPLSIAQAAAEVTCLAADAASEARGGVRGEAMTAAVLGEAVVRAIVPVVDLNLAGTPDDPRRAVVSGLARDARAHLDRAVAGPRRSRGTA